MIRVARPEDGAACARIYAPYVETTDFTLETPPPTAEEMGQRIADTLPMRPWLVWDDGEIRGYAYAGKYRDRAGYQWNVETSLYIRDDSHRRGIGTRLCEELLRILTRQGFVTAFAVIGGNNATSIAFHAALGFTHLTIYRSVGFKHGRWTDVTWMEKNLGPRTANPRAPIPFRAIASGERIEKILRDLVERRPFSREHAASVAFDHLEVAAAGAYEILGCAAEIRGVRADEPPHDWRGRFLKHALDLSARDGDRALETLRGIRVDVATSPPEVLDRYVQPAMDLWRAAVVRRGQLQPAILGDFYGRLLAAEAKRPK